MRLSVNSWEPKWEPVRQIPVFLYQGASGCPRLNPRRLGGPFPSFPSAGCQQHSPKHTYMELSEIIVKLAEHEPAKVADALKQQASNHYQVVFQRGFSTSHEEAKAKIKEKEDEADALKTQLSDKAKEIEEIRGKQPDIKELTSRYEQRLVEKDNELKAAKEEATTKLRDVYAERFVSDSISELVLKHDIDAEYAQEVLRSKVRARVQPNDDGTVKVLSKDNLSPLQAEEGKLLQVFAADIAADVDPKWKASNVANGAGSRGNGDQAGGSSVKAIKTRMERSGEYAL